MSYGTMMRTWSCLQTRCENLLWQISEQLDITRVARGNHTLDGKRTGLKGRSAHKGPSHWHRRDRSKIGPVVAAVRISAVVVAAVPFQSGEAAVVSGHHAASLVLGFDRGTILFSPARRGARQCIDRSVCWNMSIRNWCLICRLFGNGRLMLVGGLFRTLDLGKDGHCCKSDRLCTSDWNECSSGTSLARWGFKIEKCLNIYIPVAVV